MKPGDHLWRQGGEGAAKLYATNTSPEMIATLRSCTSASSTASTFLQPSPSPEAAALSAGRSNAHCSVIEPAAIAPLAPAAASGASSGSRWRRMDAAGAAALASQSSNASARWPVGGDQHGHWAAEQAWVVGGGWPRRWRRVRRVWWIVHPLMFSQNSRAPAPLRQAMLRAVVVDIAPSSALRPRIRIFSRRRLGEVGAPLP